MTYPYALPRLPYAPATLEPNLNRAAIMTHHDRIFAGHIDGLNRALQPYPALQRRPLSRLLLHPDCLPAPAGRTSCTTAAGCTATPYTFPPWLRPGPEIPTLPWRKPSAAASAPWRIFSEPCARPPCRTRRRAVPGCSATAAEGCGCSLLPACKRLCPLCPSCALTFIATPTSSPAAMTARPM